MQVYEKVRAYLEQNNIPQSAVAQKAGLSVATFHAILSGKKILYAEELRNICLALNVSPELFVELHVVSYGKVRG